jgi:hypothetical protein
MKVVSKENSVPKKFKIFNEYLVSASRQFLGLVESGVLRSTQTLAQERYVQAAGFVLNDNCLSLIREKVFEVNLLFYIYIVLF